MTNFRFWKIFIYVTSVKGNTYSPKSKSLKNHSCRKYTRIPEKMYVQFCNEFFYIPAARS